MKFLHVPLLLLSFCSPLRAQMAPALPYSGTPDSLSVVFEGWVFEPTGAPAEGAVVVTSAGGKGVVDVRGDYRLVAEIPAGARSIQVTAVGQAGLNLTASVSIDAAALRSITYVPPLLLIRGTTCQPSWLPTMGEQPGVNGQVTAMGVFDDGNGPALYVGGDFSYAGSEAAARIARWDGTNWTPLGSGLGSFAPDEPVFALCVFDDGSGPALYVGGDFHHAGGVPAGNIAKWDGTTWTALGSGLDSYARALVVFDDGSGPALFAGGSFTHAGGVAASHIAKWNGASWSSVGAGTNSVIWALTVFDDGSGDELVAGGNFSSPGANIAKWDGSNWSALGAGTSSLVYALTTFDDGNGARLYAGGNFATAGGVPAPCIARWDGSAWSAVGAGVAQSVRVLTTFDDGTGPKLYVAGFVSAAGGSPVQGIASWDGSSWAALDGGLTDVLGFFQPASALAVFDAGGGACLFAGGEFRKAGNVAASRIAKWDGVAWAKLPATGLDGTVTALAVFDDGGGDALYAAGDFRSADGVWLSHVGKWDGASWSALGDGINTTGVVYSLATLDDGNGPALYAGGSFSMAGGVPAQRIARWDGSAWSALGNGPGFSVRSMCMFDSGGGPMIHAGGLSDVAKWNGTTWTVVGSIGPTDVYALVGYDDGIGPKLFAGCENTVKKRTTTWVDLNGPGGRAFTVFDDGSGPKLVVGGVGGVAKWGNPGWSFLGGGWSGFDVACLTVFDDGSGPKLYAGGAFTQAAGVAANHIARWDNGTWSALGGGTSASVLTLAVFAHEGVPSLFAGGAFNGAPDSGDSYLAKWGCVDTTPPVLECPTEFGVAESFGSPPGEIVFLSVTVSDDYDSAPSVVFVPPSGSFFPHGTTLVTCTATDASGNPATCQFPVVVEDKWRRGSRP